MDRKEVTEFVQTMKLLPIMEAWLRGDAIQTSSFKMFDGWHDYRGDTPAFTDEAIQWRIKPVPRRWWISFHTDGSVTLQNSPVHTSEQVELVEVNEVLR